MVSLLLLGVGFCSTFAMPKLHVIVLNNKSMFRPVMSVVFFIIACNNETVVTNAEHGYLVHSMYPLGYTAGLCQWDIRVQENEVRNVFCFTFYTLLVDLSHKLHIYLNIWVVLIYMKRG